MSHYTEKLEELIPFDSQVLNIGVSGEKSKTLPAKLVELRRWGKPFHPFQYQREIIDGLFSFTSNRTFCGMLCLPTGSGKTLTTSQAILKIIAENESSSSLVIWISPQRELLYQASEALQSNWWSGFGPSSLDIKIIEKKSDIILPFIRPTCWLMTPIMASKHIAKLANKIDCIIFDEAHHAAAEIFGQTWYKLVRDVDKTPRLALGLSATPSRTNTNEIPILQAAFRRNLILPKSLGESPLDNLIKEKILSKPTFLTIGNVPEFSRRSALSSRRSLKSYVLDEERWNAIITCIREKEKGQTVVYALDREHGKFLTHHLRCLGQEAEYIDGDTPLEKRAGIFERFRNKQVRILVNVALLIEGVDCPAAESVILTYPIRNRIRLRQIVGRVLRGTAIGGTEKCKVWSFEGNQNWLENILFGENYRFSGWRLNVV